MVGDDGGLVGGRRGDVGVMIYHPVCKADNTGICGYHLAVSALGSNPTFASEIELDPPRTHHTSWNVLLADTVLHISL